MASPPNWIAKRAPAEASALAVLDVRGSENVEQIKTDDDHKRHAE
jgi:hypothetical protein